MVQDGYPVVLRIRGASCVVVGGGRAAAGKVGPLLAAGARVTVISPEVDDAIAVLAEDGNVTVIRRAYGGANDLRGAVLAFAATDRDDVNEAVCRDAAILGIPVCDTGRPDRGTFLLPAVMRRGKLTVAVSTSGASPALARKIRDELLEAYGPEYGEALDFLAELRRLIREKATDPAARSALLRELAERDVVGLAREGRLEDVRRRLLAEMAEAETVHISRWRRMLDFSGERPSTGETET
jgi:precorrin-2 dehydrogenase/sirohydrochlorin ferrochelatase